MRAVVLDGPIAAMRTRIPSRPVFDTAAWRGRVRACVSIGSRRGERRGGGHVPELRGQPVSPPRRGQGTSFMRARRPTASGLARPRSPAATGFRPRRLGIDDAAGAC